MMEFKISELTGDIYRRRLNEILTSLLPGPVPGDIVSIIVNLLQPMWSYLEGSDGGLKANKLYRMEHVSWRPPFLSFEVQRHGSKVENGKQWWDLHICQVNIKTSKKVVTTKSVPAPTS